MPSILNKYFIKCWVLPFLWALLFYGGMLMTYRVMGVTKEILSFGAPFRWIIPLLSISIPGIIGIVLPMAAVLGGLIGTSHLSESSELVAAQGLGVDAFALIKPWGIISIGLLSITAINTNILAPKAQIAQAAIRTRMIEETKTRFLRPGTLPQPFPGSPQNSVWIAPNGQIHIMGVSDKLIQHITAESLKLEQSNNEPEHCNINVKMQDISGILFDKSDSKATIIKEKQHIYTIHIPTPKLLNSTSTRTKSLRYLLTHSSPESLVELSQRFTLPLASCALLLLGIALGLGHPRFQKGGAITKSIGVIVTYYLINKYFENKILFSTSNKLFPRLVIFSLPFIFLCIGFAILVKKLRPHHQCQIIYLTPVQNIKNQLSRWLAMIVKIDLLVIPAVAIIQKLPILGKKLASKKLPSNSQSKNILATWTNNLWWKSWGSVMGSFLVLSFLVEYATLAGKLVHNHASSVTFVRYWLWNLPSFLTAVLPLAFLLGTVIMISRVTFSQEWIALRAGGTSLIQWCGAGMRSWGVVLLLTFVLQAFWAPVSLQKSTPLYQRITGRQNSATKVKSSWLYLGSTGILWFLDGNTRWGFPLLKTTNDSNAMPMPIILKWEMQASSAQALLYGAFNLAPGPSTIDLFPDKALQDSSSAEETPTLDLFRWQQWAPDYERSTMIWTRLLNFLGGPCLLIGVLPFIFVSHRRGLGMVFGYSLVAGLSFMGLQALFTGAAKAGELPPIWGVVCPMIFLVGIGLISLHRLRI